METKKKVEKTTNVEIYSFLNIVSRPLGKLYKLSGYNPLPGDFELTDEVIEEVLLLGQMHDEKVEPPFVFENKQKFKKILKKSISNCKNIVKNVQNLGYSESFSQKFMTYLNLRIELTEQILKSSKTQEFNEISAFREIHNLNSVFANLLEFGDDEDVGLFGEKMQPLLNGLEQKYSLAYEKKAKAIEKKNAKKQQKIAEELCVKNLEESKRLGKIAQKAATSKQKVENKKAVEKTKQELKTARAQDKVEHQGKTKKTTR